jgi:hypothetical protein
MCSASCAPNCDVGAACVTGAECASTVCTNNECACTKAEECSGLKPADCQVAACNAGSCELQAAPAGTSCGDNGTCSANGKCEFCGDGVINGKEDCEISAKGWDVQTCGADCKRVYYKPCSNTLDCAPSEYCFLALGVCTTACERADTCPPNPLGSAPECLNSQCMLQCAGAKDCPADLQSCTTTLGSSYMACGASP